MLLKFNKVFFLKNTKTYFFFKFYKNINYFFFKFYKNINYFFFKFFKKIFFQSKKILKKKFKHMFFLKFSGFLNLSKKNLKELRLTQTFKFYKNSSQQLIFYSLVNILTVFRSLFKLIDLNRLNFYINGVFLKNPINKFFLKFKVISIKLCFFFLKLIFKKISFLKKLKSLFFFFNFKLKKSKGKTKKINILNKFNKFWAIPHIISFFEINFLNLSIFFLKDFNNMGFLFKQLPINIHYYRFYNWKKKNFLKIC